MIEINDKKICELSVDISQQRNDFLRAVARKYGLTTADKH